MRKAHAPSIHEEDINQIRLYVGLLIDGQGVGDYDGGNDALF